MIPDEIRRGLPAPAVAHAALSCSPGSVVGETHFVVSGGALLAFTRESLVGGYSPMPLDPGVVPVLEGGDFSSTLHMQLADGTPVELNVSSFERVALAQLLAKLPKPVSSDIEPAPNPPSGAMAPSAAPAPGPGVVALAGPVASRGPQSGLADSVPAAAEPAEVPASASQALPDSTPRIALPDIPPATPAASPKKPRENRGPGEFAGDLPFLTGCLPALLLLAGAGWLLWTLEESARQTLWAYTGWALWQGTFLEVLGKIAACIGAMALTYWFGVWLEGFNFRRNLTGRVTIRGGRVAFLAAKAQWKADFDLRKCGVEFLCAQKPPENKNTKPEDLEFVVLVRFTQGDSQASIWVHNIRWKDFAGSYWQPQGSVEKPQRRIEFMAHEFRDLLPALLQEMRGPA